MNQCTKIEQKGIILFRMKNPLDIIFIIRISKSYGLTKLDQLFGEEHYAPFLFGIGKKISQLPLKSNYR